MIFITHHIITIFIIIRSHARSNKLLLLLLSKCQHSCSNIVAVCCYGVGVMLFSAWRLIQPTGSIPMLQYLQVEGGSVSAPRAYFDCCVVKAAAVDLQQSFYNK